MPPTARLEELTAPAQPSIRTVFSSNRTRKPSSRTVKGAGRAVFSSSRAGKASSRRDKPSSRARKSGGQAVPGAGHAPWVPRRFPGVCRGAVGPAPRIPTGLSRLTSTSRGIQSRIAGTYPWHRGADTSSLDTAVYLRVGSAFGIFTHGFYLPMLE